MLARTSSHGLPTLSQSSSILRLKAHFSTSVVQIHCQLLIFQLIEGQYPLNLNPCLLGLLRFWDHGSPSIRQKPGNRLMNYVCLFCFCILLLLISLQKVGGPNRPVLERRSERDAGGTSEEGVTGTTASAASGLAASAAAVQSSIYNSLFFPPKLNSLFRR
jgi:hypothetical protein